MLHYVHSRPLQILIAALILIDVGLLIGTLRYDTFITYFYSASVYTEYLYSSYSLFRVIIVTVSTF